MRKKLGVFLPLLFLTLIPTIAIWIPFYFRLPSFWGVQLPQQGMETVVTNYDGPLYLVVAKTLYNTNQISQNFEFPLPVQYYAAHFPLFPLLIKLASILITPAYAMLAVTLITSLLCLYFFFKLASMYLDKDNALWLTLVFSILPARFLIVRSIGSPEPLFIGSIIASIYYFKNKKYLLAGIWGAIAQLTKSPGILLFVAYFLAIVLPKIKDIASQQKLKLTLRPIQLKYFPIFIIPLTLLGIFILFHFTFGDFLAYFHSGDNIHLMFPPFQIFNYKAPWVGTFWLEEIIFIYLFGILGVLYLIKAKENTLSWFTAIFFLTTIFVSHRDLMRYSLPIVPFLFIAFKDVLVKKEFKIAFAFLVIPIYLFSLAFISGNVMPISNWGPFL